MKRFLSVLLILLLLFSLAVPAFASVPVVSALVAVGAMDKPVEGDVAPAMDEPVISDFVATAPAVGEVAAVASNGSFPPVYSPESYLIQSLFECNIELLRSTFKKYKYCQFVYDNNTRKFMRFFLFNELPAVPFKTSNNNEFTSASCVVDLTGANSLSFIDVYNKEPIFHPCEDGQDISFSANSAFKVPTSYNSYLFNSFNYSWVHTTDSGLTQNEFVTPVGVNAILDYAKTGVVLPLPTVPPENPFPDLGGEVTLKEFSDILDNYIADTCAPNGDTAYDLERIKGTTINFSYRNSYGSGSNVISFKDGYVYVNGAKYDFNKDAVPKKKVFGIGKSGIIDTIFSDYDVVTKHIVKFETNKDAKVVLVKKDHFGSYNFDDFPITYSIRPAGSSSPEPDLGDDKTNGFDGEYGVKILMPSNGFKQSKLNAVTTKIYYKIPFNGDETKHNIKVSGYVGDSRKTVSHTTNKLESNTVIEGYLDVLGAVNWDKVTPISITVTDYNGKAYTCSVNVLCYSDFVDNDGDGLDDRTNQDEWTGSPDLNKPIVPDNSPPEGSNIIEWVKWFFNSIGEFFATLKSGFDSVISYGADFSKFLGSAFSYLPSEISVIIGLGFSALVFLRIFGR